MTMVTAPVIARQADPGPATDASWPDILVATDGTAAADGAVCVGARLAERQHLDVELLTVLREKTGLAAAVDAESRVRAQLRMFDVADDSRRIALHSGPAARTIARIAQERRVGMIVMGTTRHGVRGLLPGAGTMSRLLPLGDTPIFAVPSFGRYIPRRLMIAVDFSMPSIRAARTAVEMIGGFTRIDIVHVEGDHVGEPLEWNPGEESYDGGVRGAMNRLIADLRLPRHQEIETWTLKGDVSSELLRFAERSSCDLITAGGRDHGLLERIRDRSVTRDLLYRAQCSLLIAPRRPPSVWKPEVKGPTTTRPVPGADVPVVPDQVS